MSKWIPAWSYVPIDYGTDVAVLEDVSQRCLIRNNLAGESLRVRFNNRGGERMAEAVFAACFSSL